MTKLSKQFSRERSLFYFFLWNDSDRVGYSNWIGYEIKNSLFLREGMENKMSVWYNEEGLEKMHKATSNAIAKNPLLIEDFEKIAKTEWNSIELYLEQNCEIKNVSEFKRYYESIVRWWSVMTIIWYVPNIINIPLNIRNKALKMRHDSEKYSPKFNSIYESFLIKQFPQYKRYLHVIAPREIMLLDKREFNQKELDDFEKRLGGFAVFNEKIYLLSELPLALNAKRVFLETEPNLQMKEIIGNAACAGIAKGKACLLLSKTIIPLFKEGDVLVTEMTDPDFLSAMKKAVAIITDEGGLTCHAAIVAREMKKPCIIGTKIATKVLKDEDLVEVDANKGIVKILETQVEK